MNGSRKTLSFLSLVLASPVVTWWTIGDMSTTKTQRPDYLLRPLMLSETAELLVGITATAAMLGSFISLVGLWRRRLIRWVDVGIVLPLLVIGVVLGVTYRVITAGVIGANIGGALMIMLFDPAIIICMLILSAAQCWRKQPRAESIDEPTRSRGHRASPDV